MEQRYTVVMLKKMIDQSVKRYLESLSDERLVKISEKILGAEGLTSESIKKMITAAKGDQVIRIYFKGGDMATIESRNGEERRGPGW